MFVIGDDGATASVTVSTGDVASTMGDTGSATGDSATGATASATGATESTGATDSTAGETVTSDTTESFITFNDTPESSETPGKIIGWFAGLATTSASLVVTLPKNATNLLPIYL